MEREKEFMAALHAMPSIAADVESIAKVQRRALLSSELRVAMDLLSLLEHGRVPTAPDLVASLHQRVIQLANQFVHSEE